MSVDQDQLQAEDEQRRLEALFQSYVMTFQDERKCTNCSNLYRPLLSMGRFECLVHPENVSHTTPSVDAIYQRELGGGNALALHYPCCGTVSKEYSEVDYAYGGWISRLGCCRADHISTAKWRDVADIERQRVRVRFNRMQIAAASAVSDEEALALRLRVFPVSVVVALYHRRRQWLINTNDHRANALPDYSHTPDEPGARQAMLLEMLGPNFYVVPTAGDMLDNQGIMEMISGTLILQFTLRDAYASMCLRFNLPQEFLHNALTKHDLAMREQRQRLRAANAFNEQTSVLREIYKDEDEENEMRRADNVMGDPAGGGGGGGGGNNILRQRQDFEPFVIASWIEQFQENDVKLSIHLPNASSARPLEEHIMYTKYGNAGVVS